MIELPADDLSGEALVKYINDKVWPLMKTEQERLTDFEKWTLNGQDSPQVGARHSNRERQVLQDLARKPWVGLMVNSFAQQLIVDGYRKTGSTDNAEGWKTWNRNDMNMQQFALNRAVLTFGYAFMKVVKGVDPLTKKPMARMRAVDPRNCYAIWEDAYWDEWPVAVLERQPNGDFWWWTNDSYTILTVKLEKFTIKETVPHDYGLIPFVRYVDQIDLNGRCYGEVEPIVTVAKALDKTALDVLLLQHHQSFQIRWGTGLMLPDDADAEKEKVRIAQETFLLSANHEAKFGAIPASPMDGLLQAYKDSLTEFLALTQLPPHIAGQIVNVAADALAAGTRQTMQKLYEKQAMFKGSHNRTMRLVNILEGRQEDADELDFSVHWQDVTIQSISQFADAWTKLVEGLKIPAWGVWDMIPNVEQSTVDGWRENTLSEDKFIKYVRELQEAGPGGKGGATGEETRGGPNAATNKQKANNKTGEPASMNKSGK